MNLTRHIAGLGAGAFLALGVATAGLAVGATAAAPSIAEIGDAPESFAGSRVTVVGTVTQQTIGYRGESLYTLGDGGRTLSVLSRAPAPPIGAHLSVTGEIALRPPDTEFTFPPVLLEADRRASP